MDYTEQYHSIVKEQKAMSYRSPEEQGKGLKRYTILRPVSEIREIDGE